MTARFHVQAGAATHVGRLRRENQDRCGWFQILNPPGWVILAADGMGGHSGGATAAQITLDAVKTILNTPFSGPALALRQVFAAASDALGQAAVHHPDLQTMGTTLSLALFTDGHIFTGHIGDSRIYRINRQGLIQISRDHSMVQEMVRRGIITAEEAIRRPDDNVLTKALTASQYDEPDFYEPFEAQAGDRLLVCSDGLWKMTPDAEIFAAFSHRNAQEAAEELVRLANSHGGEDNIAVSIIQFDQGTR